MAMHATPVLGLPYPDLEEQPNGPAQIEALAEAVEQALVEKLLAPGILAPFAGAVPAQWLLCDGRAIARAAYAKLFTAIGVAWGPGDGAATFNLPDLRGCALVGAGQGPGLTARVIATKWGVEAVVLGVPQIPSHAHADTIAYGAAGDHAHSIFVASGYVLDPGSYQFPYNGGVQNSQSQGIAGGFNTPVGPFAWAGSSGPHTHGASASTAGNHSHAKSGGVSVNGGGGAHENAQPSAAVAIHIYAGTP